MSYFSSSEDWQRQSALLLQARPSTTRITTKYHIPNLSSPRHEKKLAKRSASQQKSKDAAQSQQQQPTDSAAAAATPKVPRAYLELKTFDPESGACLKYKTDKAAEVGRLIGSLGRLGRGMAALPVKIEEDTDMKDAAQAPPAAEASGTATPQQQGGAEPGAPVGEAAAAQQAKAQAGGKNKKKKGKR